jgi:hypothetical protein
VKRLRVGIRRIVTGGIIFRDLSSRLTACVSGGQGAGGEKSLGAEKTESQKNARKLRRLPAVRCTLCWATFVHYRLFFAIIN